MSSLTETITLEQFIAKHGLRFECKRVEARPDGHGEGMTRHFRCRLTSSNSVWMPCKSVTCENHIAGHLRPVKRSFSLYFSQGSAHTADPTLADVLDCLASDARGYENAVTPGATQRTLREFPCEPTFENWAVEYGYDTDSRKAERIFRTIKRQAEQLKRTLGQEAYEELLYNTERL